MRNARNNYLLKKILSVHVLNETKSTSLLITQPLGAGPISMQDQNLVITVPADGLASASTVMTTKLGMFSSVLLSLSINRQRNCRKHDQYFWIKHVKWLIKAIGGGGGYSQCWKFPQVLWSEAENFGGGPGTFCWFFFNFMFMICDSRHEDLQLFWFSFTHWLQQQHPCDLLSSTGMEGCPELRSQDIPVLDNKSWECCCHNSLPSMINPDYNMTKQLCIKYIYEKIHLKSPPNQVTSPTWLDCDVTHFSLMTGVVASHIDPFVKGLRTRATSSGM